MAHDGGRFLGLFCSALDNARPFVATLDADTGSEALEALGNVLDRDYPGVRVTEGHGMASSGMGFVAADQWCLLVIDLRALGSALARGVSELDVNGTPAKGGE